MTRAEARARRCRGCGLLLLANQTCVPCDTATVHVITTLGPTDGPGVLVSAKLLPRDPMQDLHDQMRRVQDQIQDRIDYSVFVRGTRYGPDTNPPMRPRRTR